MHWGYHPSLLGYMAAIHITDIEAAINFWRAATSPDGVTLAPELRAWPRSTR